MSGMKGRLPQLSCQGYKLSSYPAGQQSRRFRKQQYGIIFYMGNIEFAPTWGSIQGADYCLQTELCNSFDTASLLIAMLRASNVPARYVHGTIELPIDKAMNCIVEKRVGLALLHCWHQINAITQA
jgi:hypothetical protein